MELFADGGVVEMSVNGGDYVDIGDPAYDGELFTGDRAFVGASSGTVHTSLTQAVAPGSTVRVRFRFASDQFPLANAGWTIDNIAFSGVVETPFTAIVEDRKACHAFRSRESTEPTGEVVGSRAPRETSGAVARAGPARSHRAAGQSAVLALEHGTVWM